MATMPTVKQMQDRAQEHQEVRQNAEDMSRMLGEEIEAGDGQKSKRNRTISPRITPPRLPDSFVGAILISEIEVGNLKRTGACDYYCELLSIKATAPRRGSACN